MHLGRSFGRGDVLQDWQMRKVKGRKLSRRDVLHLAVTMAAVGALPAFPQPAPAARKTLEIAKWGKEGPTAPHATARGPKRTRLNTTHTLISTAPFCFQKK